MDPLQKHAIVIADLENTTGNGKEYNKDTIYGT